MESCDYANDIKLTNNNAEGGQSSERQSSPAAKSWSFIEADPKSSIWRDCSELTAGNRGIRFGDGRQAIPVAGTDLVDPCDTRQSTGLSPVSKNSISSPLPLRSIQSQSAPTNLIRQNPDSKKVSFKSLLISSTVTEADEANISSDQRLAASRPPRVHNSSNCDNEIPSRNEHISSNGATRLLDQDDSDDIVLSDSEDDEGSRDLKDGVEHSFSRLNSQISGKRSPSYLKSTRHSLGRRILNRFRFPGLFSTSNNIHSYTIQEDKDLLTGSSKYLSKRKTNLGRTFRGSYKYSRAEISMAVLKKLIAFLFHKSTLALVGAFLIHVTLGTVYTLSNINSYLTSYMRKHGSPNATYGSSMWISSSYAVGQGFSMVLGGYIEKRFSARLACIIGCFLHSGSIITTSWAIDYGPLAVLLTYGFLPGFGCGLAYMTPMSNGFGWFPHRKGFVAGIILAGFGIGTFIFNMAQTAYVNPSNLSPTENAHGYFTQDSILDKVPHLFMFVGSIYATMQFIGCCLLFRPPGVTFGLSKLSDERPIVSENEIPIKRAIYTREFVVLFVVYGITTQGVLFVNSMLKEYGQMFIGDDMYLAWTGSMASIANSLGRLLWGLGIDRFSFTQCFTSITIIFGSLMFLIPFEFILSSKLLYLICTLGIFGSFSGWMSTYPVHLSRVFGRTNSGIIYGLIFISQVSSMFPRAPMPFKLMTLIDLSIGIYLGLWWYSNSACSSLSHRSLQQICSVLLRGDPRSSWSSHLPLVVPEIN